MAIHLLDAHTAELIAAGEVVERPASVIKELVENAIDSGATVVSVEIERGGIALMRVTDNGCGILAEDLPLAFVRHATSKVRCETDLEAIGTLGFRGEALASIASVARVELLTWNKADVGASLSAVEGGSQHPRQDAARGEGTTITVRDLFYNTPARMKFLKKDSSEGTYVTETVMRLALSHPEVAIRYRRDGKPVFETPGNGQLRDAAYTALGAEFARDLLEMDVAEGPLRAYGLITPPRAARGSRGMQFFFINGRYVKNRTMMAALEQAYRGMAMVGKFPGGLVFLRMPPQLVDVNVHPAKTEVRFAREQDVFQVVYRAAKAALAESTAGHAQFMVRGEADAEQARPEGTFAEAPKASAERAGVGGTVQVTAQSSVARDTARAADSLASDQGAVLYETRRSAGVPVFIGEAPPPMNKKPERGLDVAFDEGGTLPGPKPLQTQMVQQTLTDEVPEGVSLRFVGEVFRTYIVAETGEDVMCLIDKHAAHERLLYEQIAAGRDGAAAQQLLSPVSVALQAAEKDALLQNGQVLEQAGIELEDFGGNAVLVRAVPADVEHSDIAGLVEEVAGRLALNEKDNMDAKTEWVLHSMACRAAVKAGDKTPPGQLLQLAQDIMNGKVPPFCPHGRPVVLEISRKELEKQFGRLG